MSAENNDPDSVVRDLFAQAVMLRSQHLAAFLAELPTEQRAKVEALLVESDQVMAALREIPLNAPAGLAATLAEEEQSTEEDLTGTQIGPYKILQKIGGGGMGAVYMADQETPVRRRVALKVIRTQAPPKEILARFEAERQALSMMDHQNIARVLDAGISGDGRPWFAMELVHGISITKYCDRNRLTPRERLELFVQACRAIQHAHQKGVIHRDIKPSNVLVTLYDGVPVVKVIDFGLAKAVQDPRLLAHRTLFTKYGQIVGTLEYMSPEQAEMNALDIDTRTDVYSLGVLLYELLTGTTPVGRDRIRSEAFDNILRLIREEEAPRPSVRLSDSGDAITGISEQRKTDPRKLSLLLKGDLDWITLKALEKDRTRRYDGPAAFADDIQRYLTDEPIEARAPTFGYRFRKAIRKYRGPFLAATAIVLLLVAGLVSTGTMWLRASVAESNATAESINARKAEEKETQARNRMQLERDRANDNEQLARNETERANLEAKQARDGEAAAKFQLANARWDANRASEARRLLHEIPREYRDNFEWRYCNRHFQGSDMTLYGHTGTVQCVAYSPDGLRIASGSGDNTIRLWDSVTGEELLVLKGHTNQVNSVSFSPDGTRIASASGNFGEEDNTVRLWDSMTGEELLTLNGHTARVTSVSVNSDGSRIASGSDDNTVKLWDVRGGKNAFSLKGHSRAISSVSFSPDGAIVASGSDDGTVKLWDAVTGEELLSLRGHRYQVRSICFSPDSTRIASGGIDGIVKLWDAQTGKLLLTVAGHTRQVTSLSFSPDGLRIASGSWDRIVKIWNADTGKELFSLKGHGHWINSLSFSPDGARIASGSHDETVKVWDVKTGQNNLTLHGHTRGVTAVSYSPNGAMIASGSLDRTIKIWEAETSLELGTCKGHTDMVTSVCFSPDGARIVSGSLDKTAKVWDARTSREVATFNGHTDKVTNVCFSPDGARIASSSEDKTVRVWDSATGDERLTIGHTDPVFCMSFSPDGARIASGSYGGDFKLFDADTGAEIFPLDEWRGRGPINRIIFSPDGTRIACSRDEVVDILDANTGGKLRSLNGGDEQIFCVAFNSDGTRVATGSEDQIIKIWDAELGIELLSLVGHSGNVIGLSFNSKGTRMASGSLDGTVKVWDARESKETFEFPFNGFANSISFSGMRLYLSHDPNIEFVWDLNTGEQLEGLTRKDFFRDGIGRYEPESVDGRWFAHESMSKVIAVDRKFKEIPDERAFRIAKSRPDKWWHLYEALRAFNADNWFASLFHLGSLWRVLGDEVSPGQK